MLARRTAWNTASARNAHIQNWPPANENVAKSFEYSPSKRPPRGLGSKMWPNSCPQMGSHTKIGLAIWPGPKSRKIRPSSVLTCGQALKWSPTDIGSSGLHWISISGCFAPKWFKSQLCPIKRQKQNSDGKLKHENWWEEIVSLSPPRDCFTKKIDHSSILRNIDRGEQNEFHLSNSHLIWESYNSQLA